MKGRRGSHVTRVVRLTLWGMAVGHVLEALLLRRRREQITTLPSEGTQAAGGRDAAVAGASGDAPVEVIGVDGGGPVDEATLAAVTGEMTATGLAVVDLVPGDLPSDRALQMLRWTEPGKLVDDPLYAPGGTQEALAVHRSVAERMRLDTEPNGNRLGHYDMVRTTVKAQRHAPLRSGIRVAPGLRATSQAPEHRWEEWEGRTAGGMPGISFPPVLAGLETAHLLAMTTGLLVAPVPALAALATWSAQAELVFSTGEGDATDERGRASWKPPDLGQASLSRLPRAWARNVATILAGARKGRARAAERARTPVQAPSPQDELFDPRRDTCPWCLSQSIEGRLDTPDLLTQKPGEFHLDQCNDCGHIFQNPRLSFDGLLYYYDDFYEGLGEEQWEAAFTAQTALYHNRVDTMERLCTPRAWLDVGTGHGHFPLIARQRWPEAIFDGLDISESVEEAERRGWIDKGYRGLLPDLAGSLPRSYDVVSMHHYLEHTLDPRAEIAAAAKVLDPGGLLEIEVPDPESPLAHRLGHYWISWFQPQHLNFVPCGNLTSALEETGFEIISTERGTASTGMDASIALFLAMQNLAPSPHVPWLPAPTLAGRVKRMAAFAAVLPAVPFAWLADAAIHARLGPDDVGTAYRIVARRV